MNLNTNIERNSYVSIYCMFKLCFNQYVKYATGGNFLPSNFKKGFHDKVVDTLSFILLINSRLKISLKKQCFSGILLLFYQTFKQLIILISLSNRM